MKKLLIITSLFLFIAGFSFSYATANTTNTTMAIEQIDDDPATASESTENTDNKSECSNKEENSETKSCCKKEEESECSKK